MGTKVSEFLNSHNITFHVGTRKTEAIFPTNFFKSNVLVTAISGSNYSTFLQFNVTPIDGYQSEPDLIDY
jgi:hypothetical protein